MRAAKKRFGQHFLEPVWAVKVARAVDPHPGDVVLEIGPGRGAITQALAAAAAHVLAFEIDRELVPELRAVGLPNLTVIEGDFLEQTVDGIRSELDRIGASGAALRAAGNLPYNVAAPILFKLLELAEGGLPLIDATVMLQREVADRLMAAPGTKEYGVLAVLVRHRADVARLLALPAGAFRPPPKVQSAVVRLRFHAPAPSPRSLAAFVRLVRAVFTRRRKTLENALQAYTSAGIADALRRSGIDGRRRPETLSIPELVALSNALDEPMSI